MYSAKPIIHSTNASNDPIKVSNSGWSIDAEDVEKIKETIEQVAKLDKKILLEKELNRIEQAKATTQKLYWIMGIKDLTKEDVNKILRNPELDGKYHLLKEK